MFVLSIYLPFFFSLYALILNVLALTGNDFFVLFQICLYVELLASYYNYYNTATLSTKRGRSYFILINVLNTTTPLLCNQASIAICFKAYCFKINCGKCKHLQNIQEQVNVKLLIVFPQLLL